MEEKELIWTEEKKELILKTVVFDVTERTCSNSSGVKGKYIVNDAPDWVIVIPEVEENFLMVKQWRHGEKSLSVEFPGGVIEKGEDPKIGALRELKEETGAIPKTMIHLGTMNPNPALFSNHFHVFLAKNLEFSGKTELDADEFLNAIKIPKAQVIKEMGSGQYVHGLMAAALGLYLANQNFN